MQPIKILVATLGLAATAALAQPAPGGFGGPRVADIERLAVLLDLDPYQKQEVERVLKEQREAARAERDAREADDERPSLEEMRSRREQAREGTITKLQGVLSELQITKLKLLMEPPAGGYGKRRGPPRDAG
jgi:hypothetical protein